MLPRDGFIFKDFIFEGKKAFGDVGSGYVPLIDLGDTDTHNHLSIQCTLNVRVVLRFGGVHEITVEPEEAAVFDDFLHANLIEVKHAGVAPSSGYIKTRSW